MAKTPANTDDRARKERLFNLFALFPRALANPRRLELLDLLAQAPRSAEDLARESSMAIANASQHLQRLLRANLVQDDRRGRRVIYRIAHPDVTRLWVLLRDLAATRLAEIDRAGEALRESGSHIPKSSADEAMDLIRRGEAILLDVRPLPEFEAAHLPKAVSMPLGEIESRLDELPRRRTIIAYCRGPYCTYADQALLSIAATGRNVRRLEEGVPEWWIAGRPLEAAGGVVQTAVVVASGGDGDGNGTYES